MDVGALLVTKQSENTDISKAAKQVSVQVETSTGEVIDTHVQDNGNGNYAITFLGKQVGHAKIVVSVNGKQIKGSPYSIVF